MSPLLIPVLGILVPIVIVPTALGLKHARLVRELEHAERMKALEVGRTLPQDEPWWSPAKVCVAIGAAVPIGSMVTAWMASESLGYKDEIWGMSTAVALSSLVCGSVLASKHFRHKAEADALASSSAGYPAKARHDADAFDVVGTRG